MASWFRWPTAWALATRSTTWSCFYGDDSDYHFDDDDDHDGDDDNGDIADGSNGNDNGYGHLVGSDKSIGVWGDKTVKPISNLNNSWPSLNAINFSRSISIGSDGVEQEFSLFGRHIDSLGEYDGQSNPPLILSLHIQDKLRGHLLMRKESKSSSKPLSEVHCPVSFHFEPSWIVGVAVNWGILKLHSFR